MDVVITHLAVSAFLGCVILLMLALAGVSIWGAYILAEEVVSKLIPEPMFQEDCPRVRMCKRH